MICLEQMEIETDMMVVVGYHVLVQTGNVKRQRLRCECRSQSLRKVVSATMIVERSLVASGYTMLVGGLEHFLFSHIMEIMIPID